MLTHEHANVLNSIHGQMYATQATLEKLSKEHGNPHLLFKLVVAHQKALIAFSDLHAYVRANSTYPNDFPSPTHE